MTPLHALFSRSGGTQARARLRYRQACPTTYPADQNDREQLALAAHDDAIMLAVLVREEDPAVVFGALTDYTHEQLSVLAVVLAALLPLGLPTSELTQWINWDTTTKGAA